MIGFVYICNAQDSLVDSSALKKKDVMSSLNKITSAEILSADSSKHVSACEPQQRNSNDWKQVKIARPVLQGDVSASANYGYPAIFNSGYTDKLNYEVVADLKLQTPIPFGLKMRYNSLSFNQRNLVYSFYFDKEAFKRNYLQDISNSRIGMLKERNNIKEEIDLDQAKLLFYEKKKADLNNKKALDGHDPGSFADSVPAIETKAPDKIGVDHIIPNDSINNVKLNTSFIRTRLDSIDEMKYSSFKTGSIKQDLPDSSLTRSIDDSISFLKQRSDSLNRKMESVGSEIKLLDSKQDGFKGKMMQKISFVKDFNLGFFSPSYSAFLVNRSVIYGANLEYEHNFYLAAATGKVIRNYYTNVTGDEAEGRSNPGNIINPGNFSSDTRITVLKLGPGKKDEDHLHIGILSGRKTPGYYSENSPLSGIQKNLVMEVDAKYLIKRHVLNFTWGKSTTTYESKSVTKKDESAFSRLLKEKMNNAFLLNFGGDFQKLKTRILLQARLSEPYFRSFGLSYMRADDLKIDFKSDHSITRKLKLSLRLIHEEDNLWGLYQNKFKQEFSSVQLNYKLNRRLSMGFVCSPVFYRIQRPDSLVDIRARNLMNTFFANFIPKSKETFHNLMFLSSYNLYEGDSEKFSMINFSLNENMIFQNMNELNFGVTYIENRTKAITRRTLLDLGYGTTVWKKIKITPRLTLVSEFNGSILYGYSANISCPVSSKITLELNGQKNTPSYEFEDRYSTVYREKPVPYYCYLKLTTKL